MTKFKNIAVATLATFMCFNSSMIVHAEDNSTDDHSTNLNYEVEESYKWEAPADIVFTDNIDTEAQIGTVKVLENIIAGGKTLVISIGSNEDFKITSGEEIQRDYKVKKGEEVLSAGSRVLIVPSGTNDGQQDLSFELQGVIAGNLAQKAGTYTGELNFEATLTSNYRIEYHLDGGVNNPSNPATYEKDSGDIVLANPSKEGYTFEGWYTEPELTNRVTSIVNGTEGNIDLYAKFVIQSYTITYVLNGGTNNVSNPNGYDATTLPITLYEPTKAGVTFAGWYEASDFSGSPVTQIDTGATGNKTFYAKWEEESIKTYVLKTGLAFNKLIPSATTSVVFTDETMPANATLIDVDADGDRGVVGWLDGTTFKVSTQNSGQKIIFNEDSSYMFCGSSKSGNKTTVTQNLTNIDFTNIDTSGVTNMLWMFVNAGANATTFSLDLSGWNTSNVTNMSSMFGTAGYNATSFNLDLSGWDTSKVEKMAQMFYGVGYKATTWAIEGLSGWDISSVTDMSKMFYGAGYSATTFNLDLSGWDTSSVTNMSSMFGQAGYNATSWSIGNISGWDTSNVTNMSEIFYKVGYFTETFNLDLSGWNTSSVTNMSSMFAYAGKNATTFSIEGLSNWDTSSVTNMTQMFNEAGKNATYSLNLSGWNTSNVTAMSSMFSNCSKLETIYVSDSWNTDKVIFSDNMFTNCTSLVGGNDTKYSSSYTNKTYAKIDAVGTPGYLTKAKTIKTYVLKTGLVFNALIPETTTSIVFTDEAMPVDATLIDVDADGDKGVVAWLDGTTFKISTQKSGQKIILNEDSSYMFCGGSSSGNKTTVTQNLTSITGLENLDTSKVTNMQSMFESAGYKAASWSIGDISGWDTSKVTNMSMMFDTAGYKATTFNLDLSNWDVSSVTNMGSMFSDAGKYATTWSIGDLSGWNTSSVTNMSRMFYTAGWKATTFNLDLSGWNTSNVTNMSSMFAYAGKIATTWSIGDLSGWDTSKVRDMNNMFYYTGYNTTSWSVGDISGWNTSNVTNMSFMFKYAGSNTEILNLDLSGWDTSSVTNMSNMFCSAGENATIFNLDLSGWNTSKVTDMRYMFGSAGYKATTWSIGDISGWNTSSVTNMDGMFWGAGYSTTSWSVGDISSWDTSKVYDMSCMFQDAGYNATYHLNLSGWNVDSVTFHNNFNFNVGSKITQPIWVK